ncbi:hypothetical protein K466DRAFT_507926, partial [Polyporus arcularius HHB13444]
MDNPSQEDVYDYGLHLINEILFRWNKSLADFPPMPLPQHPWAAVVNNPLLQQELNYDPTVLADMVDTNRQKFNPEQAAAFASVMHSIDHNEGKTFFLHSAGGCGKTFVCNTIAAAVRSQRRVALTVASSGIASLLLVGGRTAHSRFKIPIPIHGDSTCPIKKTDDMAEVLNETGVVI